MTKIESGTSKHYNGQPIVKIDICGVAKDGTPCWWVGFDKTEGPEGTFQGIPKKTANNTAQDKKDFESSKK